jgi:uncharacterized membrane protein YhaH (DUF805 family)
MNYYVDALRKYAVFRGRARRREFWMFELVNLVIGLFVYIIGQVIGLTTLDIYYGIVLLLPSLAVLSRRLHDTDRSAGWIWLVFLPIVGPITLIVFACLEGTRGPNRYGPNPKAIGARSG